MSKVKPRTHTTKFPLTSSLLALLAPVRTINKLFFFASHFCVTCFTLRVCTAGQVISPSFHDQVFLNKFFLDKILFALVYCINWQVFPWQGALFGKKLVIANSFAFSQLSINLLWYLYSITWIVYWFRATWVTNMKSFCEVSVFCLTILAVFPASF